MAGKQSVIRPPSLTAASSKTTSYIMMLLLPRKRRKKLTKKRKSEIAKAYPVGMVNTYGIEYLTIGEATYRSDD